MRNNDTDWRYRFFVALQGRRRWALAFCGGLTVLLLLSARGITWREDVLDLLPDGDPVMRDYRRLFRSFRPTDYMYLDVGPAGEGAPIDESELLAVADALAERLMARSSDAVSPPPLFNKVLYRRDADDALEALDYLRRRRAALFTSEDAAAVEKKLKPETIRAALEGWKKTLTESPAPMLLQTLLRDPLHFDEPLLERLSALQPAEGSLRIHKGRLFSRDAQHVLIIAQPRFPSTDSYHARELIDFVDPAITEATRAAPSGNVRVAYLAGHRFSLENADCIKRDLKLTLVVTVLGIALLSFIAFSRPLFVPLVLLPAVFGGVFALGIVRWLIPGISAISIGCGSMLVGIAVDYGIHVLYHADQIPPGSSAGDRIASILSRLTVPLSLGAGTTVAAFVTLQLSVLPGYRHLGAFAALGIVGAAAFSLTVLPLAIPRVSRTAGRREPRLRLARLYPRFFAWGARHRPLLAGAVCALSLFAAAGLWRLEFEGDYRKMNALSDAARADWERLAATFGDALEGSSVVVQGADLEDALGQNEKVYAALRRLENEGTTLSCRSLAPIVPSAATQEGNRRRWQAFWTEARLADLRKNLTETAQALRMRVEAFEPFLQALTETTPATKIEDLPDGMLQDLAESQIAAGESGNILIMTGLRVEGPDERFAAVVDSLEEAAPGAIAASGPRFVRRLVGVIYSELRRMASIALVLIVLLLLVAVRRPDRIGLLLLPLLLSLLWTFGAMGWLGLRINLMNSIVCIFIFGLVIDYSIFLFSAARTAESASDEHLGRTGGAVAISALTTLIGFGSLTLAGHPALHSIGATALLGIAGGWIAVLLIVPLGGGPTPAASAARS
ncbi:MAG TPA: MMPL family transporter [Sumerlaeia bacterium]|nr:MMPL family transporter [Sumerlaeia bacterium]